METTVSEYDDISQNKILSEDFIEEHADKVNWDYISIYQNLSENFIEKHQDKVNWLYITIHQKLSENFIEKHQDKVNWFGITMLQNLSEDFIERNYDKLKISIICNFQNLSKEFLERKFSIVYNCGKENRTIKIYKGEPEIIYIGCFKGTKDKAIEAIRKKYKNDKEAMTDYIDKVEECFNNAV